jgi:hypothetical protein
VNSTNVFNIDHGILFKDWADSVQAIYLQPSGINRTVPFSYNNVTVASIIANNENMKNTPFYVMRGNNPNPYPSNKDIDRRPFSIIQCTMDGPFDAMPWDPSNRNYSLMEWTPLYAGVTYTRNMHYHGSVDGSNSDYVSEITVGGYVQPFSWGGKTGPSKGLNADKSTGSLNVPLDVPTLSFSSVVCDLCMPASMSSWAVGNTVAADPDSFIQRYFEAIIYSDLHNYSI